MDKFQIFGFIISIIGLIAMVMNSSAFSGFPNNLNIEAGLGLIAFLAGLSIILAKL